MSPVANRRALCLPLLLLHMACARLEFRPSPSYEHARLLFRQELFDQAEAEAKSGFVAAPSGSKLAWDFQLLDAEILLARGEGKAALDKLSVGPPDKPDLAKEAARFQYCRGFAYIQLNQKTDAIECLNRAQVLAEKLASPGSLLGEIELRRARISIADGNSDQAKLQLRHVINLAEARHDEVLLMSATGNMGFLFLKAAAFDEAMPWFRQTLNAAQSLHARKSEALTLGNLGWCYFGLGDLVKALGLFQQAEAHFTSIGMRAESQRWLGSIGDIEENTNQLDAASRDYAKALAISRDLGDNDSTAMWLSDLALVSIQRRNWGDAERYNNEAASLYEHAHDPALQYTMLNSGFIAAGRNQFKAAEESFRKVVQSHPKDTALLLDSHLGLAGAYLAEHRETLAEQEFQIALQVIVSNQAKIADEQNKLTWFSTVIRFYQQYVEFLMSRGKRDEALEVAESSRGRVLSSRMELPQSQKRFATRDLQKLSATSGSTLLIYWVTPNKSYAWAVSGSSIHCFPLPDLQDLSNKIDQYNKLIQASQDPMRDPSAAGQALYESLIRPAQIRTKKVMLAPDGPLHLLNFATLPVRDDHGSHYWIEDAQVTIVPSFELKASAVPKQAPSLLLMGNPLAADPDFPELQSAGAEMNSIQTNLPPDITKVVRERDKARPEAFSQAKPEQFAWIHFVSHATANEQQPLESAVILSRGAYGYKLFARDVLKIPLQADLVTISACHSAGAHVYAGEGLVGFSWAFLRAGARNVIAGLWNVDDRSGAQLMADMYRELGHGASPAEALRTAQLAMLGQKNGFRKPYYWGPFETFSAVPN